MAAMQLLPADVAKLLSTPKTRPVDLVFYVGCNAPRTPHLLFNTMYVLDALGADYEVLGGPSSCCGVIAAKWEGDAKVGGRMSANTLTRFASFQPGTVLNWCPTCEIHLNSTLKGFHSRSFDFMHVTQYLLQRTDELRAAFTQPVRKRVVLHGHRGALQVSRDVELLLRLVPGLEIVETVFDTAYTCGRSGSAKSPELREQEQKYLLERVDAHGADALITLFHSCHMTLVKYEKEGRFEVLNFTDLLAEALGRVPSTDRLKHFRLLDDWPAIVNDVRPFLEMNKLEIDLDWLERNGASLISLAEFSSDFDCTQGEIGRAG
jgi:Fe-S oxidoreductase